MTRYFFVVLVMGLLGIAIVVKAAIIMFAERQYWQDVADRFIKENVTVKPNRGNILSSDGKLMASSLPEYRIYMDFKAGGVTKDTMLVNHMNEICEGLHKIFPDKSAAEFKSHLQKGRKKGSRNYLIYPKRISYIQYKEAKRLPVFNLNKYKGGFHEQVYNQRKKPFIGSPHIRRSLCRYCTRCKKWYRVVIRHLIKRSRWHHSSPEGDEQVPEYCRYSPRRWL